MAEENCSSDSYRISGDKSLLQFGQVVALLRETYWAKSRSEEVIRQSIENSLCYGVYCNEVQIGFARVITDCATAYYLCDVVIDEAYRGKGLGRKLIDTIVSDDRLRTLFGLLITKDAHGLYEQFGFIKDGRIFMYKR